MITENKKASELPLAGIILEHGNSEKFNTGEWRSKRPIHDKEKCKHCMMCVLPCPDNAIIHNLEDKMLGIDYSKCKGCGVCAKVCPFNAIYMVPETDDKDKEACKIYGN